MYHIVPQGGAVADTVPLSCSVLLVERRQVSPLSRWEALLVFLDGMRRVHGEISLRSVKEIHST